VSHLGDEELVLHYYGEDGPGLVAVERHLRTCAQCARAYEALARTLNAVTPHFAVRMKSFVPVISKRRPEPV